MALHIKCSRNYSRKENLIERKKASCFMQLKTW